MAEDVTHLTYELLKLVSARLERVEGDVSDPKTRLTGLETGQALIRRDMASMRQEMAQQVAPYRGSQHAYGSHGRADG